MKISVLTPSYNSGEYIERAIQSVLHQDYDDIEHIVVDGGSSDKTLEILKRYNHLKWISEKDKGQSDAMNKAFKMATGDIIVYLNADDYFNPKVFQTVIDYFTQDEVLDILVGNLYLTYAESTKIRFVNSEHRFKKILLDFKYGFPYNPVCYFYKREVQEKVGSFPLDNHYTMDFWFIIHAFENHRVEKTDLVLGNYFDTGFNKSSVAAEANQKPTDIKDFVRKHKKYWVYYYLNLVLYGLKRAPQALKQIMKVIIVKLIRPNKSVSMKSIKSKTFRDLLKKQK